MGSTYPRYKKPYFARLALRLALSVFASAVLVLVSAFFFSVVTDGISAKLMGFESEPAGGLDPWRRQYQVEALKGWAIPILFVAVALAFLLRTCFVTCRAMFTWGRQTAAEQPGDGKPDPALS